MIDPVKFDSVSFWDMAGEKHLPEEKDRTSNRSIQDIGMVPLPGDHVCFGSDDEIYVVVYREFKFRHGTCFVRVNVQPAGRDEKLNPSGDPRP